MTSRYFLIFPVASVVIGCCIATSVFADTRTDKEFIDSCSKAFTQSGGEDSTVVGRQLCECIVKESKKEHVSPKVLQRETERIKKDPKYKIQDPGLLSALQNCSIDLMKSD